MKYGKIRQSSSKQTGPVFFIGEQSAGYQQGQLLKANLECGYHSKTSVWNWRDARFGLVISAIPILIIVTGHVEGGLPMLIGALPVVAHRAFTNGRNASKSSNHRITFWKPFDAGLVYGTVGLGCGPWYVLAGLGWIVACLKEFVWHGGT